MTLKDKRIVILGGTSGIGFATAQAAALEGAAVVVVSSRQSNVDKAVALLPKNAESHAADLSSEDGVRGLFERIGAFDHLAFTAGESGVTVLPRLLGHSRLGLRPLRDHPA